MTLRARGPILLASLALLATALSACTSAPVPGGDGEGDGPPVARASIVGQGAYEGPATAEALRDECGGDDDWRDCYAGHLEALLAAEGAEAAFWMMENVSSLDGKVLSQSHPMAHDLGRYAYAAYGSIQLAMEECSYKVFAGCFHGALEAYFSALERVSRTSMEGLCPTDNRFREYTCLHGVGHGLMMNLHNDVPKSLHLCDGLPTYFGRGSCYGGVFMQNMVGYFESLAPQDSEHHHHSEPEDAEYWVDEDDPYHPCNEVEGDYKQSCWLIQTSLILYFNGGDFEETAGLCAEVGDGHADTCFRSYGRDAAAYTHRDLDEAVAHCSHAPTDHWKGLCMAGYVAESILHYADPERGLPICSAVPEAMKSECYRETGQQARYMRSTDEAVAELCGRAEDAYQDECRAGGLL